MTNKKILLTEESLFVQNLHISLLLYFILIYINFDKNSQHLLNIGIAYLFNLYNHLLQGIAVIISSHQIDRKLRSNSQEVAQLGSESCSLTMTSDAFDDGPRNFNFLDLRSSV